MTIGDGTRKCEVGVKRSMFYVARSSLVPRFCAWCIVVVMLGFDGVLHAKTDGDGSSADTDGPAQEFADLVTLCASHFSTLSPFDVAVNVTISETSSEAIGPKESVIKSSFRGRLIVDNERKLAQWFCETLSLDAVERKEYRLIDVKDNTVNVWHANAGTHVKRICTDYDEALSLSQVPRFESFALFQFPHQIKLDTSLQQIRSEILSDKTKVSTNVVDDKLMCLARVDKGAEGKFDVFRHEYSLPSMRPTLVAFDRALSRRPITYFENAIIWDEFQEQHVPTFFFIKNARFQNHQGKMYLASREIDIELSWVSAQRPIEFVDFTASPSVKSVERCIKEGYRSLSEKE